MRRFLAVLCVLGVVGQVEGQTDKEKPTVNSAAQRAEIERLINESSKHYQQNQVREALDCGRQALELVRNLYPASTHPDGHSDLVDVTTHVGYMHMAAGEPTRAEPLFRNALAMARKLYPKEKHPDGHREVAGALNNLAFALEKLGEPRQAEPFFAEALTIYRGLYPRSKYPLGDFDLATLLNNVAALYERLGEYGRAQQLYVEALEMRRKLFNKLLFPDGHESLMASLSNLGSLYMLAGDAKQAAAMLDEAAAMGRKLFPKMRFPDGHPALAQALNNRGALHERTGEFAQAETLYREVVDMNRRLYPAKKFPRGHPHLFDSLNNWASVLRELGEDGKALPPNREAVAMAKRLYPAERFPEGHPDLALAMLNLSVSLSRTGEHAEALQYGSEGLRQRNRQAQRAAAGASEAEVRNFLATTDRSLEGLISLSRHIPDSEAESYELVWAHRGFLTRMLEQRHRFIQAAAATDPDITRLWQELIDVRRRLPVPLGLAISQPKKELVVKLSQQKESLERELLRSLARQPRPKAEKPTSPKDLAACLPTNTAFVDVIRYLDVSDPKKRAKGERLPERYVAFVVRRDKPVVRVELGEQGAVDRAVREFRIAVLNGNDAEAGRTLRRLVWDPLAQYLPDATDSTIWINPDGELARLPWSALPGRHAGSVLLEDHAVAVVPHGHYLLDRLQRKGQLDEAGKVLLVGGVRYDQRPGAEAQERGKVEPRWPFLDGAAREIAQVRQRAAYRPVVALEGQRAGTLAVLQELPSVRFVHLATHGFFVDGPEGRKKHGLDEEAFAKFGDGVRVAAGARNPLTQCGLVLAGANLAPQSDADDGGLLTAEVLASLSLKDLELAVLSACETGLGELDDRAEGVHGLQRALHIAGARDVVGALWKVNDDATAALMNRFYYHLWEKKLCAVEALRFAQLELYRNPTQVAEFVRGNAPKFSGATKPLPKEAAPKEGERAATKLWAAFVLSGVGR